MKNLFTIMIVAATLLAACQKADLDAPEIKLPTDRTTIETSFEYDAEGRLLPQGADDNWHGSRKYLYDDQNRLTQTYRYTWEGMTYRDELVWDERGNVVKRIMTMPKMDTDFGIGFGEPVAGTIKERVHEYTYDNRPKPNFGVPDNLFWDGRFNPWPGAGNADDQLVRTLSRNNLLNAPNEGNAYRYTYNEEGLPVTVETLWLDNGAPIRRLHPIDHLSLQQFARIVAG